MLPSTMSRRVGKTQLHVSPVGLGSSPLTHPSYLNSVSWAEAKQTVRYFISQGMNFIDTAPMYGLGKSETLLGETLKSVPRENYILSTKVGRLIDAGKSTHFDYTRDGILRSVDESLKRLQIDSLDIAHLHDPDDHFREALDVAFPTLEELKRQGVIRAIGAGMNQWEMLKRFAEHADFDCFLLAGRYSLLEQESLAFLSLCERKQISVFLGGIYNGGILATGAVSGVFYNYSVAPRPVVEQVRHIDAVCQRHQIQLRIAVRRSAPGSHVTDRRLADNGGS